MTPDEFMAALDADAADEARYQLLAATFDEHDDAIIIVPDEPDAARLSAPSA